MNKTVKNIYNTLNLSKYVLQCCKAKGGAIIVLTVGGIRTYR
jgi:hypothetical protein